MCCISLLLYRQMKKYELALLVVKDALEACARICEEAVVVGTFIKYQDFSEYPDEYRQDPIKHEDMEYRNNCPEGPLSEECILVA